MVTVKKLAIFPSFLGKIGPKNLFYDVLKRKNASLDYKKKKLKLEFC